MDMNQDLNLNGFPGLQEQWQVSFDGGFGGHGCAKAGEEIPVNKRFVWHDEAWTAPAVYVCDKGLVVDFCAQVPKERIRAFMDKWSLSADNDGTGFSDEQRMKIDAENPLAIDMHPKLVLNGAELSVSHGYGLCWNPCLPEGNRFEAKLVMRHYGLDPAQGYAVLRNAFPWKTKRKPKIKTLSVTLTQNPVAIPGPHFRVSEPGDQVAFTHPFTGEKHTLTVQEYKRQELAHLKNQKLPTHYTLMSYTLFPELRALTVEDCAVSDAPRYKRGDATQAAAIGIIGGTDGPTAIISGSSASGRLHAACSALHFEPVEDVEWRMVFHKKMRPDITVTLINTEN